MKQHPDYLRFEALMNGPYLKLWELKEVLRTEAFKSFARLFPEEGQPGSLNIFQQARLELRQQPYERDH